MLETLCWATTKALRAQNDEVEFINPYEVGYLSLFNSGEYLMGAHNPDC